LINIIHLPKQIVSTLTVALAAFCLLLPSISHSGQTALLDNTVQHLIAYVAASDLTFIRNSSEYSGKEASEHMQAKYAHFRDKIKTPEDFIELCASRSLLSGKPYLVVIEKGETIGTREWLTAELQAYRNGAAGGSH
jgi:hypothetical protein